MRRMLTAKLQNSTGVPNHSTGVPSWCQVNIGSISVGYTMKPNISRITIIIGVESLEEVKQIIKQLNCLINVLRVRSITDIPHLECEAILVRSMAPTNKRTEVLAVIRPSRASIVDVVPKSITIQVTGNVNKIETLLRVVKSYGTQNLARTGVTGFSGDFS